MWLNITTWLKNHNYNWRYKLIVCTPIFVVLVALDWISKGLTVSYMEQGQKLDFIPGIVKLQYILNPGSAGGANADNLGLTITLATLATLVITIAFIFINDKKWLIALTFLMAGSIANLIARAWAPAIIGTSQEGLKGAVVDMFVWDFALWGSNGYIFNLADMWVNIGIGLLILAAILEGWNEFYKRRFHKVWNKGIQANLVRMLVIFAIITVISFSLLITSIIIMSIKGIDEWILGFAIGGGFTIIGGIPLYKLIKIATQRNEKGV
ncbi:signal peptidase II [[Acholeplasma] multilocale]|uniref:signal peptidase II n=1 Tax=[Acholeplasma] multilocale TaxID=264638 RepID=UPI000686A8EC|nr:signal peptidase II [[Acholeplasma] multilocale]